MGWRTLYIEDSHKVSLYLNNMKIEDGDEQYIVPIADIDTVIFNNYKMYMTVQLLCKLSQNNVCVIVCEKNGLPELVLNPLAGNFSAFKQQKLQLNFADGWRKLLWQTIIKGKIANQAEVLEHFSLDMQAIEYLQTFRDQVDLDDVTNREGLAAKVYFRALFGELFTRERGACDAVNITLNYGYAIIRSMLARSVVAKGLLPTLGIKHCNQYNHFNLVDDFIEPYRTLIDQWVYSNIYEHGQPFAREKRLGLIEALTGKIIYDDKRYTVAQSMNIYVDSMVNFMKTGVEELVKMPGIKFVKEHE
ncbi:MAG: type II CRISPR-associated endonuclease Cas1 [Acidaminococcaceae bacterium]|nr:type II CRISPR-associated endonuclease Cas1 [Acidaminococcaceae bacterium]